MTRNVESEFLLREALTLLMDDPTPRNVAMAMGPEYAQELTQESQTEASEESESQVPAIAKSTKRQMFVLSTKSAQNNMKVVDRDFVIDAYVSPALERQVLVDRSISVLRGSLIEVDKYYFSTPSHCRAMINGSSSGPEESVSTRSAYRSGAKLSLFIESFKVTDSARLQITNRLELENNQAVAAQLAALSPEALLTRLMRRQGLSPDPVDSSAASTSAPTVVALSGAKQFDDHNPLLDEDCEIPEDQERELDEQDGWGVVHADPTDSQLISENGPVARSDSQVSANVSTSFSSSGNTVVSSNEAVSPPDRARIVVLETEPQSPSQLEDQSVPESQDRQFLRENLQDAFMEVSDTDSDDDGDDAQDNVQAEPITQPEPMEASQSQAAGEFVGEVRYDFDEPMTQQVGEHLLASLEEEDDVSSSLLASAAPATQAPDATPGFNTDEDFEFGEPDGATSQHDGQADHWMQTQPEDPTPTQGSSLSQERRKRKRSLTAAVDRPSSPQVPSPQAARSTRPPLATPPSSRRSSTQGATTEDGVVAASVQRGIFGISKFNKRARSGQQSSQSGWKRYEHLFPPWDNSIEGIKKAFSQ